VAVSGASLPPSMVAPTNSRPLGKIACFGGMRFFLAGVIHPSGAISVSAEPDGGHIRIGWPRLRGWFESRRRSTRGWAVLNSDTPSGPVSLNPPLNTAALPLRALPGRLAQVGGELVDHPVPVVVARQARDLEPRPYCAVR